MATLPITSRPMDARAQAVLVRRILKVWRAASADRVADGLVWYPAAYDLAAELTPHDVRIGAGILAALSPQNAWASNVAAARQTIRTGSALGTHTGCQTGKADAILAGIDPLEVLRGQKERAFFQCIADPDNTVTVVVDRHAHDIAAGRPYGDSDRGLTVPGRYANIARAYVRAAQLADVTPNVLQATTWLVWRDLHVPTIALSDENILTNA